MVESVGNAPTRIVRLKAGCPSIVALTPLKLVLCSPRRLCVLPNVPVGSPLRGQLPVKIIQHRCNDVGTNTIVSSYTYSVIVRRQQ